jgi:hypothetical protein
MSLLLKKIPSFFLDIFEIFNQADVKKFLGLPEKNDRIIVMHLSFLHNIFFHKL